MSNSIKRRSDLGSVREIRPGRWQARITHGVRADGKPDTRSKVLDTEQEAWDWVLAMHVRLKSGAGLRGVKFSELWRVYEINRMPELALSTQSSYRLMAKSLLASFADRDITEITYSDVQKHIDNLKPSVAQKSATTMSAILTYAAKNEMLRENPLYRAPKSFGEKSRYADFDSDIWDEDPFAAIEDRRDVWSMTTALKCMELIRGLPLEPVFLACVGAGLRVEEAFALRKMDVRRVVGSFDEWGNELWVTQLAVHHASTREERRKATKTMRSVGIVPMLEPFGERYWELVQACGERGETVCKMSPAKQNRHWRSYFDQPPTAKNTPKSSVVRGKLYGMPYIPLSRMRATHTTYLQEQGMSDSLNQRIHRNTSAVQIRNYMEPDTSEATAELGRRIR